MENFMMHVANFGLNFETLSEFNLRHTLYEIVDAEINKINADASNTFTAGHNHLSTWTEAEKARLNGTLPLPDLEVEEDTWGVPNRGPLGLSTKNWASEGYTTPVKDQGSCGSCWAFSSSESMESAWAITNGISELNIISQQQLVDCETTCYGCNGGWTNVVFDYYSTSNPILESNYPYTAADGVCQYSSKAKTNMNTTGAHNVSALSNTAAIFTSVDVGPTSIAINASAFGFQTYKNGVYNGSNCSTSVNHAVLAVGYGTESGSDYVLIQNSWGASWGDNGFIKMATNTTRKGMCGMNTQVNRPNV